MELRNFTKYLGFGTNVLLQFHLYINAPQPHQTPVITSDPKINVSRTQCTALSLSTPYLTQLCWSRITLPLMLVGSCNALQCRQIHRQRHVVVQHVELAGNTKRRPTLSILVVQKNPDHPHHPEIQRILVILIILIKSRFLKLLISKNAFSQALYF